MIRIIISADNRTVFPLFNFIFVLLMPLFLLRLLSPQTASLFAGTLYNVFLYVFHDSMFYILITLLLSSLCFVVILIASKNFVYNFCCHALFMYSFLFFTDFISLILFTFHLRKFNEYNIKKTGLKKLYKLFSGQFYI